MTDADFQQSEELERAESSQAGPASVWLLVGEKRGDNAQVRNLAAAVGRDFVEKNLVMKPEWVRGKPPLEPSID